MRMGGIKTKSYADYLIPTVYDVPDEIHPLVWKCRSAGTLWCARVGRDAHAGTGPAILDAIHDATGIWFNKLPVKAEDVLLGLRQRKLNPSGGLRRRIGQSFSPSSGSVGKGKR